MFTKSKNAILKIDNLLFSGRLKILYLRLKKRKEIDFFKGSKTVVISEPVSDLLLMQFNKNENYEYQFFDIAVRVLAIENYYGFNDFGFALYRKLHTVGGNYGNDNQAEIYYSSQREKNKIAVYGAVKEEHSIEQFRSLIQSYDANGYDSSSLIMCDRNLLNMNGSHRIALAIYRKQKFINIEIHNLVFGRRRFNNAWFWEKGFTRDEIQLIKNKLNEIIYSARQAIGEYYFILFPPVEEYFEEITEDLRCYDSENLEIIGYHDYRMKYEEFESFLRAIYSFDSINQNNFARKMFYIKQASDIKHGNIYFRIIQATVKIPSYRLKKDNGLPESEFIVKLKDAIRNRFKVRDKKFTQHFVGDYAHDVIIHSTDNYISNNALKILLSINKDLTDIFTNISQYHYAVIESGSDKVHPDFPHNYYYCEDIDIFISESEVELLAKTIVKCVSSKYNYDWIRVNNTASTNGRRVQIVLLQCVILIFDLMYKFPELNQKYIMELVLNPLNDEYKYLRPVDEFQVRLAKYINNPRKEWHANYLREHKNIPLNREAFVDHAKAKQILDHL